MAIWPTTPQAIRARISSYRRVLRQEYEGNDGPSSDGYGKRYWLFPLFFLLREDTEVRAYIDWYVQRFPDDIGEVSQFVCWALILHRLGREDEAVYRLVKGIDENLPAVAKVVDDYQGPYGMRGEEVLHFHDLDAQLIAAMTAEEHAWLRSTWRLPAVVAMRERRIADGRAWAAATTQAQREALSKAGRAMTTSFKPKEMPPLSSEGTDWLTSGRVVPRTRSTKKVIVTTPETWRRCAHPLPAGGLHEIVVYFTDRHPLRIRAMVNKEEADMMARMLPDRSIVMDDGAISMQTATRVVVVPDGQGPEDGEVLKMPSE